MSQYLLFLKNKFFKSTHRKLNERKKNLNVQYFDDLLRMVRDALASEHPNKLKRAVIKKYKAAMIDEFQDTDSVQYAIFSQLFSSPQQCLFMIGDPKQAIYGFRGADIFSYMQAAGDTDRKHTLQVNWRSEAGLIHAVNTIFSNMDHPFIYERISFQPAIPAPTDDSAGVNGPPFRLCWLDGEDEKPVNKTDAVEMIAKSVAHEIAMIATSDGERISIGDIAVLVRTNRQARTIRRHLSQKHIPSVLLSAENVFDTREALELYRVLGGIANPGDRRKMMAAVTTDLIGLSAQQLDQMQTAGTSHRDERFPKFNEYLRNWRRHGFIPMINEFVAKEAIKPRLLTYPEGERRLTNLLHLIELLHQAAMENDFGVSGLLKWFEQKRDNKIQGKEEHQLRMESDERAVKVITIHKSKGLEFPVVFCPFNWENAKMRKGPVLFHDKESDSGPILDIGSSDLQRHIAIAEIELLAENLRLLYVAVTRARKRCYLYWGNIKNSESSAPAYLFHYENIGNGDIDMAIQKKRFGRLTKQDLIGDLIRLEVKAGGTIHLVMIPDSKDSVYHVQNAKKAILYGRVFSGAITHSWRIMSYSSMISQHAYGAVDQDRDAYDVQRKHVHEYPDPQNPDKIKDIFQFPKGARAGTFFHDVFENLDFTRAHHGDLEALITSKLKRYGFEPHWKDTVVTNIRNTMMMNILPEDNTFTLGKVKMVDRIHEMEFSFPIQSFTTDQLKKVFIQNGPSDIAHDFSKYIEDMDFFSSLGMMKGFIDLIFQHQGRFYILDWKSNHLGFQLEDYRPEILLKAMHHERYTLQYHLYTVAVHRYLESRISDYDYQRHFGGVIYLFIRGIDPNADIRYGVFYDRPSYAMVRSVEDVLITGNAD